MSRLPIRTLRTPHVGDAPIGEPTSRGPAILPRGTTSPPIALTVNGKFVEIPVLSGEQPLLWVLRDHLGLKGTKFGCGVGGCGACMVHLDGLAVQSCMTPAKDAEGKAVTTIEGLAQRPDHPVLCAWLCEQVPQCGYCQPGMIMAAAALLARSAKPSDAQIDDALSPVLCRCGTYHRARRAVHRAGEGRWAEAPFLIDRLPEPMPDPVGPCFVFNPWVKIAEDGTVIVVIGLSEMGQGATTSLPMLVAEELEIPLTQLRTQFAPADHVYDNPIIGEQITAGSMGMQLAWLPLRRAGAEVRERLIAAAAKTWGVTRKQCRADNGEIVHGPTNRRLSYGQLAKHAATLPAPSHLKLKPPEEFRLLGKPTARLDLPSHVSGRTVFGIDVMVPGMLAATVALPPMPGAKPTRMKTAQAKAIDGVREVLTIKDGIAIVADDIWSAMRGREALEVEWSGGDTKGLSNATIFERFRKAAEAKGRTERNVGHIDKALATAASVIEAEYELPYLAHVPIEPINCTARVADGRCDIWVPTQSQSIAKRAAAKAAGVRAKAVHVHTTFLGGGFGRRSEPDVVAQAVEIAKAVKKPVQLVWTREDDLQHDPFRSASLIRMRGGLDKKGRPTAWFQRIVGPELVHWDIEIPYDIANVRVECVQDDPGIPTGYWRSVGASQNAFAIEGFIDELAHAAGADPVAFRLGLLGSSPRERGVLELAAEKAGWGTPLPDSRARGVAVYLGHGGWAAQIAEVSVAATGQVRVHRVVCAIDCGFVVNPDTVKAQIEGGIAFGLTAVLKSAVTIQDGRVMQRNFHDYPLLTMSEMPKVEVHIIQSREDPSGVGEAGVPPIAPAVVNAIFAATGIRIRSFPIRADMLRAGSGSRGQ